MHELPLETGPLYVKRGATVSGPFPRRLVLQRLVLGSVRADDELSLDGLRWEPASHYRDEAARSLDDPGGAPADASTDADDWACERRAARLRWIDERSGRDRREGPPPPGFPPRGPDRRGQTAPRRALFVPSRAASRVRWVAPLLVILLLAASIAVMRWWGPSTTLSVSLVPKVSQTQR